ncbi:hypothetical protein DFJ73DRAFT_770047 [Zopfochytrium polystomum]|nr:hypothetical protein DFJ73DRAFT_770047 [Zopfochytrium polystomum]
MLKLGVTLAERPPTVFTSGDQQQFNNHITLDLIETDYKQEEKLVIPPPVAMVNPDIDPAFDINTQEYCQASEDERDLIDRRFQRALSCYTNLKREHDTAMNIYLKKLEKYEEYLRREASACTTIRQAFTRTFHDAHVNIKTSHELLKAIITNSQHRRRQRSHQMDIPSKVLDADILVPHLEKWISCHYEFVNHCVNDTNCGSYEGQLYEQYAGKWQVLEVQNDSFKTGTQFIQELEKIVARIRTKNSYKMDVDANASPPLVGLLQIVFASCTKISTNTWNPNVGRNIPKRFLFIFKQRAKETPNSKEGFLREG